MKQILYLTNSRLPTEKANGYQIVKTCQAFSKKGCEVSLTYPYRQQEEQLDKDPFDYYQIDRSFCIRRFFAIDWLRMFSRIHPKLEKYGFLLQSFCNALMTLLLTLPQWSRKDIVFFSRDLFIAYSLLLFRPFIRGKIVFESHRFPESRAEKIIKRIRKHEG